MNIKQKLREALQKKPKRVYEYGCVMVGLDLDGNEWSNIQEMISDEDLYLGDKELGTDGGFGRELDPHVTVLFGIHADVPDEDIEVLIDKCKKPELELQKISTFDNELFDVLKFDITSPDLHKLNALFTKLPHTTSYPDYHPHATICYLKKGMADKYKKKMKDIEPIIVTPKEILYSKPDGKKKHYKI
jgi:2'-5' RNA ligase